VDRLGVVTQRLLSEPFRVATFESTLRPGIAVRVKGHPFDLQSLAPLLKLGSSVARAHRAKIGKQWALLGASFKDLGDLLTESDQRRLYVAAPRFEFLARVADGPLIPLYILGAEVRRVGLRGSSVPKQFVEISALRIGFAGNDRRVLRSRDGAFGFEKGPGPLQAGDNGFEQPIHAQSVIVDTAEVNVRGHFCVGQRLVKVLRASLRNSQVANAVEILILDGDLPAKVRLAELLAEDVLHDLLPSASAEFGIGTVHVNAGQREVEMRLALGVVVGLEQPLLFILLARFETGLLSRVFVFEVINAQGRLINPNCCFIASRILRV